MWQSLTLNLVENLFLDSFISHQPLRTNHSLHEIRTLALGAPCDVAHVWSSVSHLPLRLPHLAFPASGSLGSAPSPTHPLPPEASGARSLPGADVARLGVHSSHRVALFRSSLRPPRLHSHLPAAEKADPSLSLLSHP